MYIDGASQEAVTVTIGRGSDMTGVDLYQNRLIVRSNTGSATVGNATALTNSDLAIADNVGDSDITAIYEMNDSDATLRLFSGELYVWTGSTFTPGGRVKTHDVDIRGTLTLGTDGLTVSGSLGVEGSATTSTGVRLTSTASG